MGAVEVDELVQEGERAVRRLVGMDGGEAESRVVVDRHVQVLPAGLALRLAAAIAGHAMAWPEDPSELLDVDVHELAGTRALVANDLLAGRPCPQS